MVDEARIAARAQQTFFWIKRTLNNQTLECRQNLLTQDDPKSGASYSNVIDVSYRIAPSMFCHLSSSRVGIRTEVAASGDWPSAVGTVARTVPFRNERAAPVSNGRDKGCGQDRPQGEPVSAAPARDAGIGDRCAQSFAVRSRSELPMTLTEESAIAAAAITGDNSTPNTG